MIYELESRTVILIIKTVYWPWLIDSKWQGLWWTDRKLFLLPANGMSVLDLLILPKDLLNTLNSLKVVDFDWNSDHANIPADLCLDISKLESGMQNIGDRRANFTNIMTDVLTKSFPRTRDRVKCIRKPVLYSHDYKQNYIRDKRRFK